MKRVLLSWSSGKDSAWTLFLLQQRKDYELVGLLTTFNSEADRVAMHGVRRELVQLQAHAANLPLWDVDLPSLCSNSDYESAMRAVCERAVQSGVDCMAFGDLFLTDVRRYREKQLATSGIEPIFPVWGIPTSELAREMISSGVKAKLTCIDRDQLDIAFAGRDFDSRLLSELPASVDPCGENGEFHSFVYAGPMFNREISVDLGEIVDRGRFVFADVVPAPTPARHAMTGIKG